MCTPVYITYHFYVLIEQKEIYNGIFSCKVIFWDIIIESEFLLM